MKLEKYKSKLDERVIEAVQLTDANIYEVAEWLQPRKVTIDISNSLDTLGFYERTPDGITKNHANINGWIARDIRTDRFTVYLDYEIQDKYERISVHYDMCECMMNAIGDGVITMREGQFMLNNFWDIRYCPFCADTLPDYGGYYEENAQEFRNTCLSGRFND